MSKGKSLVAPGPMSRTSHVELVELLLVELVLVVVMELDVLEEVWEHSFQLCLSSFHCVGAFPSL